MTRATSFHRSARAAPWFRDGRPHAGVRSSDGDTDESLPGCEMLHDPDWLLDLKDEVTRSVFAVEGVADRIAAMRHDSCRFQSIAAELRHELDAERTETGRRLAAQGRSLSREQRRTAAAEACADDLATMLADLERQLSSCRAQTERLVDAVDHVVASEADRAAPHR